MERVCVWQLFFLPKEQCPRNVSFGVGIDRCVLPPHSEEEELEARKGVFDQIFAGYEALEVGGKPVAKLVPVSMWSGQAEIHGRKA